MRLLLDTHALLWFGDNDPRVSATALEAMADPANELLLSPASYWELAIKVSLGKYQLQESLEQYVASAIQLYQLEILPVDIAHAGAVARLPYHHRDPFDRLLIAQAMVEQVPVVSSDRLF